MQLGQMKICLKFVVCFTLFTVLSASITTISGQMIYLGPNFPVREGSFRPKNNYTIITSRCKGPQYKPELCCSALKDFACPFSDVLNDLSNDCASTMFSYINLYGKYPPGLFASECREGKLGLECPPLPPSASVPNKDGASSSGRGREFLVMIIAASFLLGCFF